MCVCVCVCVCALVCVVWSSCAKFNPCCSTAGKCSDLRHCSNLTRVVGLYPYEPLPDAAFHAPLLPLYPSTARVHEDVQFGCHQGAIYPPFNADPCRDPDALQRAASFLQLRDFLLECGTRLNEPSMSNWLAVCDEKRILLALTRQVEQAEASDRAAHNPGVLAGLIQRHLPDPAIPFVNKYHQALAAKLGASASASGSDAAAPRYLLTLRRHALWSWYVPSVAPPKVAMTVWRDGYCLDVLVVDLTG
jgi:hypothetical protein